MLLLSVKIFSIPSLGCLKSFLWTKGSGDYHISREVSTDEESHSGKLFPSFVCLGQHFSLFLVSLCYPLLKETLDIQYYLQTYSADSGFWGWIQDKTISKYLSSVTIPDLLMFYRLQKYGYHLNNTHDPMERGC